MANGQQSGLERVAGRVTKASISFLTGVPQIELDRLELENRLIEEQGTAQKQVNEAQLVDKAKEQQLQNLFGIITNPNSTQAQKNQAANAAAVADPRLVQEFFSTIGITEQADKDRVATRALEVQSAPTREAKNQILRRQIVEGEAEGRDMRDSKRLIEAPDNELDATLAFIQAAALSPEQRATGARAGTTSKLGQSVVTTDPEGNLSFATPVLGPSGEVVTQTTPIGGKIVSRSAGETSAQRQQRDIETAGGQTTARAVSARDQNFIDVGQRQADGTAIIRRGIQLLETIKTGTPEAIALAATNLLGITGADETELNANLGKAVLSQLRSTFGAQFTESEGKRLAGLEAAFGKSTAGNRRLLEQTLKAMERDARRGIDAARRNEDQFSIDEIEKALEFSLGPEVSTDVSDDDRLKDLGF